MRRLLPTLLLLACGSTTPTDAAPATRSVPPPVAPPPVAPPPVEPPTVMVDPAQLRPGPVHQALTAEQRRRVEAIHAVLAEVDTSPLAQWLADFSRDRDPDREIETFEAVAAAFTSFVASQPLGPEQRKEAYGMLIARSASSSEEVLAQFTPEHLTPAQVRALLAGYRLEPRPVTVTPAK